MSLEVRLIQDRLATRSRSKVRQRGRAMRVLSTSRWAVLLVGASLTCSAAAQGAEGDGEQTQNREAEVIRTETRTQTRTQIQGETDWQNAPPELLNRERLTARVQAHLQKFLAIMEQYRAHLEEQRWLEDGADTEEAREQARAQVRAEMQEWMEDVIRERRRSRDRVQEMKDAVQSHKELFEHIRTRAREELQDKAREGVEAARERVRAGTD